MSDFKSNLSKFTIYSPHVYFSTCVVIDGGPIAAFNWFFYLSSCCRCIDLLQDFSCMSLDVSSQSCTSTVMPRTNACMGAAAYHQCASYHKRSSIRFFFKQNYFESNLGSSLGIMEESHVLLDATVAFSETTFKKTVKDGTRSVPAAPAAGNVLT